MNPLNSIIIEGNVKEFTSNLNTVNAVAPQGTLMLECKRKYKDGDGTFKDEVSTFKVRLYGQLCIFLDNAYKQGKKVDGIRVVGRMKQERWQDSTGKAHSAICIIAEHLDLKPCPEMSSEEQEEDSEDSVQF